VNDPRTFRKRKAVGHRTGFLGGGPLRLVVRVVLGFAWRGDGAGQLSLHGMHGKVRFGIEV
jgi:hypothetical protein